MSAHEILRQIESAGYRVTGYRDALGDEEGPFVFTAEHRSTKKRRRGRVFAKDESEALRRLAHEIGMNL